jgi:hypothetical protein
MAQRYTNRRAARHQRGSTTASLLADVDLGCITRRYFKSEGQDLFVPDHPIDSVQRIRTDIHLTGMLDAPVVLPGPVIDHATARFASDDDYHTTRSIPVQYCFPSQAREVYVAISVALRRVLACATEWHEVVTGISEDPLSLSLCRRLFTQDALLHDTSANVVIGWDSAHVRTSDICGKLLRCDGGGSRSSTCGESVNVFADEACDADTLVDVLTRFQRATLAGRGTDAAHGIFAILFLGTLDEFERILDAETSRLNKVGSAMFDNSAQWGQCNIFVFLFCNPATHNEITWAPARRVTEPGPRGFLAATTFHTTPHVNVSTTTPGYTELVPVPGFGRYSPMDVVKRIFRDVFGGAGPESLGGLTGNDEDAAVIGENLSEQVCDLVSFDEAKRFVAANEFFRQQVPAGMMLPEQFIDLSTLPTPRRMRELREMAGTPSYTMDPFGLD